MTFSKPANFIDRFKTGDNINYNLDILKVLYDLYNSDSIHSYLLIKPIVILNTSITEAILYDFIEFRIRRAYSTEIMFADILSILQSKKLDKFEHYIIQAEKYDFFDMKDTDFYRAMHSLRKKRNRIHIQNQKLEAPANEIELFDVKAKELSEKVLEKTINTMIAKYPRREEYHGFVRDFIFPWDKHFAN